MSRPMQPIGFFDSGIGGLTVARELRALLPAEDFIYFADSAHCPYGERSPAEIQALALAAARFLIDRGAKLIVVACNTASTVALACLRETFAVPFVGMVPAVKPAAAATRNGRVAVLATAATVATTTYAELVDAHAAGIEVIACPAPGLVELVEQGILDGPQVEAMLARYLAPARAAAADTLVLGCTHYPFLRPVIERLMGPAITVIDTGAAVARQAVRVLMAHGLARPADMSSGQLALYTSGDIAAMRRALARLLPDPAFQPVWVEGVAG